MHAETIQTSTAAPVESAAAEGALSAIGTLDDLEQLSGFVSDMMMAGMSRNARDLDRIIKDRLGPDATIEDARRIVAAFQDIDAA